MTEAEIITDDANGPLPSTVRQRGRPRLRTSPAPTATEQTRPGMEKAIDRLLEAAMRGETGHVIRRWPVTSLTELRDAIDAAIEVVTTAGGADIGVGPADLVLAHFPRGDDKPYRMSIRVPVRLGDDQ